MTSQRAGGPRRWVWCVSLIAACLAGACARGGVSSREGPPAGETELRVAAASDVQFALDEIVERFRREHAGVVPRATYGSSGSLFGQLVSHAPFDIFLSAEASYPARLVEQGLGVSGTEFAYAVGKIVVWVPRQSPVDLPGMGIKVLLDPRISRIAIANPEHAPYGRAAVEALTKLGVYQAVEARLVYGENVAQAAQFVRSGGAEAAVIALSLAVAPPMASAGRYWEIPRHAYTPLRQGGVILEWAVDRSAAEALRSFVLSDEARQVFDRYGFLAPEG